MTNRTDYDDHGNMRSWQPKAPTLADMGKPRPAAPAAPIGTPTPGPWFVRNRIVQGEIVDCFVAAPDCNGFPFDAEIMGDDEYTNDADMARKQADAHVISASLEMLACLREIRQTIADDYEGATGQDYSGGKLARIDAAIAKAEGRNETT